MLTKLVAGVVLTVGAVFAGFGLSDGTGAVAEAVPDCCAAKLACCDPPSACCEATAKLGCCAEGQQCCAEARACCDVQECCVTGEACCDEGQDCCGPKLSVTSATASACCTAEAETVKACCAEKTSAE